MSPELKIQPQVCCPPRQSILAGVMVLMVMLSAAFGTDERWTEDAAAAAKIAQEQSKDLLLLFTGSDWCPPCKKLEEEVLIHEQFLREASDNMVLVKFDFPQNRKLPEALANQNEEWKAKYGVTGFPTVVLIDKELRPFGILGYEEGGFQPYLGHIEDLRQRRIRRDEAFAKATTVDGVERAKLIDQGLSELAEAIVQVYYGDRLEELRELDPGDELGLRAKWFAAEEAEARKLIITDILTISRLEKPERAIAFIDEVLAAVEFPIEQQFEILQIKLNLFHSSGAIDAASQLLDQMIAMDGVLDETKERLKVKKALQIAGATGVDGGLRIINEYLKENRDQPFLSLAKAQLLDQAGQTADAAALLDDVANRSKDKPDLLIDLVAARADMLCDLNKHEEALQSLDSFADDLHMPTDLRCEALLHKAMIMRETSRRRPAQLAENRAIEIADTPELKREIQQVVDRLRKKFGDQ